MKKPFFLFVIVLYSLPLLSQDRITGHIWATRSEVIAQHGMACTSQPLATQVALDILKQGGSAIDAAIAANACLGLMEPTGCGIGGDLFAIVWEAKTRKLYGLNASGRSPKALTLDHFKQKNISVIPSYGPLPVTVPGCVDGWFELHKKFGKLPLERIFAPAIQYAEEGFPLTELIADNLGIDLRHFGSYFPNVQETWAPGGKIPQKGEILKNPALANTYRQLAKGGRNSFYQGKIAATIADFVQKQGGFLSVEDLATHTSEWVEPISVNYRGYEVWELPPNGQGLAALQMLNILEGYDLKKYGFGSPEHIHYFIEAKKLAFEDRAKHYADPTFYQAPLSTLLSKTYAAERRKLIKDKQAWAFKAGENLPRETIYMTVADNEGNMISLIQSNFKGMGSGMVPPGLGFMLQDRGKLFNLQEGHANTYAPGKRPFHTIIPSFVTKDGQPFLSFGVMGGDFQPLGHVQILVNIIDFGMNIQEAGDAPRIDHNGSSSPMGDPAEGTGEISLENGFSYATIRELMKMGHKISFELGQYGGYQAIRFDPINKVYYGASDSRKDGHAAGY